MSESTGAQLRLDLEPIIAVEILDDEPLPDRFARFHRANPHVYRAIVAAARYARRAGVERIGIAAIFERLRWEYRIQTRGDAYALNNSWRSFYARLVMEREPDLAGMFSIRRGRHVEGPAAD